jgi:hypothetical protein
MLAPVVHTLRLFDSCLTTTSLSWGKCTQPWQSCSSPSITAMHCRGANKSWQPLSRSVGDFAFSSACCKPTCVHVVDYVPSPKSPLPWHLYASWGRHNVRTRWSSRARRSRPASALPLNAPTVLCSCQGALCQLDTDHGMLCPALAAQFMVRHDILKVFCVVLCTTRALPLPPRYPSAAPLVSLCWLS